MVATAMQLSSLAPAAKSYALHFTPFQGLLFHQKPEMFNKISI